MPDDYGEFGGNGSVQWKIECNDPAWTLDAPISPQGHRQEGKDLGANQAGDRFTISLRIPAGMNQNQFRTLLANGANWVASGNRLEFDRIQVESNTLGQIKISWPRRRLVP